MEKIRFLSEVGYFGCNHALTSTKKSKISFNGSIKNFLLVYKYIYRVYEIERACEILQALFFFFFLPTDYICTYFQWL